jgi:hypothetical protein
LPIYTHISFLSIQTPPLCPIHCSDGAEFGFGLGGTHKFDAIIKKEKFIPNRAYNKIRFKEERCSDAKQRPAPVLGAPISFRGSGSHSRRTRRWFHQESAAGFAVHAPIEVKIVLWHLLLKKTIILPWHPQAFKTQTKGRDSGKEFVTVN